MARLVLNPTSTSPQEVVLHQEAVSIGRDLSNGLVVPDRMVSRRHAVIEWRGGRYHVRDCSSRNGSVVNGDRVRESSLSDGDVLTVGATDLLFQDGPATGDSARTEKRGSDAGCLTAQQASLVRAVALNRADYLQRSYFRDAESGERVAYCAEEDEWSRFAARWAVEPVACIGAVNRAINRLGTPARITKYLEAAVDLETLMDQRTLRAPQGRVASGIPGYIMDGYTDMGRSPFRATSRHREKIRVDKKRLKSWLVESRWRALSYGPSPEELLTGFSVAVRRSLGRDDWKVQDLPGDWADQSIRLSRFIDDGIGLCRHMSILYQLCLQEAAIPARVVKGSLYHLGTEERHAWNLAWLGGRVVLVDVSWPGPDGPLIVAGDSQEEVYRAANRDGRRYVPTPDEQNRYKIGPLAD